LAEKTEGHAGICKGAPPGRRRPIAIQTRDPRLQSTSAEACVEGCTPNLAQYRAVNDTQ